MNAILTRRPEWIRFIPSFGEMGKRLAEWMNEDKEAFITMQKTLESYQAFSQNLISETDAFFATGRSPAHQYVSGTLKHASDERMAYQIRNVAKQRNEQLTQPARAIYWQKIEEAVARHDRETLKYLSQEMRDQTTIFNKLFSASIRSEYKIGPLKNSPHLSSECPSLPNL
ncbi:MAG: hypothetical protein NUV84_04960, partial [Candidatus Uhrbacteria bacterium]|nr:hypothetical protein [Candidatus Uhrbacteria bacterium]